MALLQYGFRRWAERGVSATFYVHPWEYDETQPRMPCGRVTALRHYRNLSLVWPRMEQLLAEFPFTSVAARYREQLAGGFATTSGGVA